VCLSICKFSAFYSFYSCMFHVISQGQFLDLTIGCLGNTGREKKKKVSHETNGHVTGRKHDGLQATVDRILTMVWLIITELHSSSSFM
jgi:hypothetical protein